MPGRTDGTNARYVSAINPLNRIARLRWLRVRNYVRGVPTGFTGILFVNSADRRRTVKRLEKTSKRKTASVRVSERARGIFSRHFTHDTRANTVFRREGEKPQISDGEFKCFSTLTCSISTWRTKEFTGDWSEWERGRGIPFPYLFLSNVIIEIFNITSNYRRTRYSDAT